MNDDPDCKESSSSRNILLCDSHSTIGFILPCIDGNSESTSDIIRPDIDKSVNVSDKVLPSISGSACDIILPSNLESSIDSILLSNSESVSDVILPFNSGRTVDVIPQCNSKSANDVNLPCSSVSENDIFLPCNSDSDNNINLPGYSESASDIFLPCNSESTSSVIPQCNLGSTSDIILQSNSKGANSTSADNLKNVEQTTLSVSDSNLKQEEKLPTKCEKDVAGELLGVLKGENVVISILSGVNSECTTLSISDSNVKQEEELPTKCEKDMEGELLGVLKGENTVISILSGVNSECKKYTNDEDVTTLDVQVPASQITFKCDTCELLFDIHAQLETHKQTTHRDGANGEKNASIAAVIKDDTIDERTRRGPIRRSFNTFKVEPSDNSPVKVNTQDERKRCLRSLDRELHSSNLKSTLVEQTGRRPDYPSSHFRNLKKFRAAKEFGVKKSLKSTMFVRPGQLRKRNNRPIHDTTDQATPVIIKTSSRVERNSSVPKMIILCEKCKTKFANVFAFKKHTCLTGTRTANVSTRSPKRSNLGEVKKARNISVDKGDNSFKYSLEKMIKSRHLCDICEFRTDRRSRLVGHKLRSHGPKPYVCSVNNECNAAFSESIKRDRHIRRKHSVEEIARYDIKITKGRLSKQRSEGIRDDLADVETVHEKGKKRVGRHRKERNENSFIELNYSESMKLLNKEEVERPHKKKRKIKIDESTVEESRRLVGRPRKEYEEDQITPLCLPTVQNEYEKKQPFVCDKCGKDYAKGSGLFLHKLRSKNCRVSPQAESFSEINECVKKNSRGSGIYSRKKRNKIYRASLPAELFSVVKQEENDALNESIVEETFGTEPKILKNEEVEETPDKKHQNRRISETHQEFIGKASNDPESTVEEKLCEDDDETGESKRFHGAKLCTAYTFDSLLRSHKCEICGKHFVQRGSVYRHCREIHGINSVIDRSRTVTDSDGNTLFECGKCGSQFGRLAALFLHCESSVTCQIEIDRLPARRSSTQKRHSCNKCGRQFFRPIMLLRHQMKSAICKISTLVDCTEVTNDLSATIVTDDLSNIVVTDDLSNTVVTKDVSSSTKVKNERQFVCNKCGRRFQKPNGLFRHQTKNKICKIPTSIERTVVKSDPSSNDHPTNKNDNERQFECNGCGKRFVYASWLNRHLRISEACRIVHKVDPAEVSSSCKNKSMKCARCGLFVQAGLMNKHRKSTACKITALRRSRPVPKTRKVAKGVGESVSVIVCEVCAVEFPSVNLFRKHECISQNSTDRNVAQVSSVKPSPINYQKLFVCPTCNENFTKPEVLKLHTDAGCTLVKRHACTQCPMTFAQFNSLKAHLLLHTVDSVEVTRKRAYDGSRAGREAKKGDAMFLKDYAQLVRSVEESVSASTPEKISRISPKKNINMSSPSQSSRKKRIKT